jgi:hypothetical protein
VWSKLHDPCHLGWTPSRRVLPRRTSRSAPSSRRVGELLPITKLLHVMELDDRTSLFGNHLNLLEHRTRAHVCRVC